MSDSLRPHGLYRPWNSSGQNTGVGSLSLLQGIFPNQGLNPGLPHCRQILYQLSHKGSLRILEWVDFPFSRGSFQTRDQTQVSHVAGRFFTSWAVTEVPMMHLEATMPAQKAILLSQKVLLGSTATEHAVDPWTTRWIRGVNPTAVENLSIIYSRPFLYHGSSVFAVPNLWIQPTANSVVL